MANTSLTGTDLLDIAKAITQEVAICTERRLDLQRDNIITDDQSELLSITEVRLNNLANYIKKTAVDKIIDTDLNNAKQVLTKITNELTEVINQLKDFNEFFKTLADLTNLFSKIAQAIAGGVPAIINTLVGEFVKSTDSGSVSRDIPDSSEDDTSFSLGNIDEI